jgi:capsular polysaccharide transport system permease protein
MRSAYYDGYGEHLLSRPYIIGFALVSLFLGLLLERLMRGYLLQAR